MITIRPGSHTMRLLHLLSIGGEFPPDSLSILGSEEVLKKLIRKLVSVQNFRSDRDGKVYTTKLLMLSGKDDRRTIRLCKGSLPVLNEIHTDALGYYMDSFRTNKVSGNKLHKWRNHRVSEVIAMNMMAGIETRPYILPKLQMNEILRIVPNTPSFYIARDFKKLDTNDYNKNMYTRIVGALFYPGGVYAVYNTREAIMKWSGTGEFKAAIHLQDLSRMNAGVFDLTSALLFGNNPEIAKETIIESDKSKKMEFRFDNIYQHIHYIPMDQNGIRLMRILTLPDWKEKMLNAVFESKIRTPGYGFMEYDAFWNGLYIFSHLDSDIARLIRFHEAQQTESEKFKVLCYPWQEEFLKGYLSKNVELEQIQMDSLEKALGLSPIKS